MGGDMTRWLFALVIAALASPAAAQNNVVILTGSTSGVYYPLGNAISGIFLKSIPGVRASVQVTQGRVEIASSCSRVTASWRSALATP